MNFLRKALASDAKIPKANHGKKFTNKERQYYELQGMLRKLLTDVQRYTALWGQLLACKTSIYGYLLYFYNQKSAKRTVIDDLFKFHTRPMEKYINKLKQDYEKNVIGEITEILKIFPETQKIISTLSLKKQQYLAKKSYYQQLKHANTHKNMDYSNLSQVDEQVRILHHTYDFSVRTVIREFDEKVDHKDSILDRFCIRMLESDGKLYSHLFKTSQILRDKSLIFQYHREYPQGLPSYYRDYSYRQDIQSPSDSDITAPSANVMYDNNEESTDGAHVSPLNQSRKQQFMIKELTDRHGFVYEKVHFLVNKYPKKSYDKLLAMLVKDRQKTLYSQPTQNITDLVKAMPLKLSNDKPTKKVSLTVTSDAPPPAQINKKRPKAPIKSKSFQDINENENKSEMPKSETVIKPSHKSLNINIIKSEGNIVRNRRVSSPDLFQERGYRNMYSKYIAHKTPPPPPRGQTSLNNKSDKRHFRHAETVDLTHVMTQPMRKPPPSPPTRPRSTDNTSDKSSSSVSPELQHSNTDIVNENMAMDSEDSLNAHIPAIESKNEEYDTANEDEWTMPTAVMHDQSPIQRQRQPNMDNSQKKKVIPKQYGQIAQLLKKDNRVQPWIWNKANRGEEGSYRYGKPSDKVEEENKHPLGVGIHTMLNFKHMHQLFHPKQNRNIGDPLSNCVPNRIHINDVIVRSVNIRRLAFSINKLDPKMQSMIYSGNKQKIQNIPKPIQANDKTANTQARKGAKPQQKTLKKARPPPTPHNGSTPPPPSPPPPRNKGNDDDNEHE